MERSRANERVATRADAARAAPARGGVCCAAACTVSGAAIASAATSRRTRDRGRCTEPGRRRCARAWRGSQGDRARRIAVWTIVEPFTHSTARLRAMQPVDPSSKGTKQMAHVERRAVVPAAIATPHARETTLATRTWRSRVAIAALLRELRPLDGAGLPPRPAGRLRRLVRAVFRRHTLRPRTIPELAITADWRMPGETSPTVGRRRLGEPPTGTAAPAHRAGEASRDVDMVLTTLGDLGPDELERALRVVRRVRSLAGAA